MQGEGRRENQGWSRRSLRSNSLTDEMTLVDMMGLCGTIFLVSFAICASIAYLVAGIVVLIISYGMEFKRDCDESNIWFYALVSVVFHSTSLSYANVASSAADSVTTSVCALGCIFCIELVLTIWGGVEVFQLSCSSLHSTSIYIFAYVSFIKQICTLLFLAFFPCILFLFSSTYIFLSQAASQEVTGQYPSQASRVQTPSDAPGKRADVQESIGGDEMKISSPSPDQRLAHRDAESYPMVWKDSDIESDNQKGQI